MEELLKQILTKLEKLDKMEEKLEKLDKMELDLAAVKSDVRRIDKKVDSITEVVAKTMEDTTELKDKVDKQDVEIRVIKGGK